MEDASVAMLSNVSNDVGCDFVEEALENWILRESSR